MVRTLSLTPVFLFLFKLDTNIFEICIFFPEACSISEVCLSNISTNSQKTVYGGLLNSRRIKQYASMHILAKGSLATVDTTPMKTTVGKFIQSGPPQTISANSYTNVGGPGDQDKSVPLGITGFARGNKARVYSMPGRDDGVDVKHGSYNRYLARKKGLALRCSNC